MAKQVKLSGYRGKTVYVNPEYVASVSLQVCERPDGYRRYFVLVRMRDGEVHWVEPAYGESVYQAQDRVARELSA
jgi:hypothetical protein